LEDIIMAIKHSMEWYHEFELEVVGNIVPFVPERISGPPEDCYPSEGGYAEVYQVFIRKGKERIDITNFLADDVLKNIADDLYVDWYEGQDSWDC